MWRPRRRFRCLAGVLVALAWLLLPGRAADAQRDTVDVAKTLQLQSDLLGRALASLRPTLQAQPQLYCVGFAGYGRQAVFKREVLAVRQLFDARYGTRGRSIALVNHQTTLRELPLASTSNLERTLAHLGTVMNPSRDVLFLFLTSHGEEGLFVVEMPSFGLQHLRPAELKDMLDRKSTRLNSSH